MNKTCHFLCYLGLGLILLTAIWGASRLHRHPLQGMDDANIFYSYAENLAAGKGIVYGHNSERVEGFTSLLWMLICASQFRLGLNEAGVLAVSIVLFLVMQGLYIAGLRRLTGGGRYGTLGYLLLYVMILLSNPGHVTWLTVSQMDIGLWSLLVAGMLGVVLYPPVALRGLALAAVPFLLAPLALPESLVAGPAFIALAALSLWARTKDWKPPMRLLGVLSTGYATSLAGLTVFRMAYFGYPLPNTYYAKVSPSTLYNLMEGGRYFLKFILSGPVPALLVAVVGLVVASWARATIRKALAGRSWLLLIEGFSSRLALCALSAALLLVIPVLVGGDHFYLFRFYQPALPIMAMTLVLACHQWRILPPAASSAWRGPRMAAWLLVALAAVGWLSVHLHFLDKIRATRLSWFGGSESPLQPEFDLAARGMERGRMLQTLFESAGRYPSLGVIAAGGIARTYPGLIIDTMGLNNVFIGHFKGERKGKKNHAAFEIQAFHQLAPEVLAARPPVYPETDNNNNQLFKGLFFDPGFVANWRFGMVYMEPDSGAFFEGFFATTFLAELLRNPAYRFLETARWTGKYWERPAGPPAAPP